MVVRSGEDHAVADDGSEAAVTTILPGGQIPGPTAGQRGDAAAETTVSRGLVWANAVLWCLLVPTTVLLGVLTDPFKGRPQLQGGIFVAWLVFTALLNLLGSLGLARALQRIGGAGGLLAVGALIQFGAVVVTGILLGCSLVLEAYRQIGSDGALALLLFAGGVGVAGYLVGQFLVARALRTLSRRLAVCYAVAPLMFTAYGATALFSLTVPDGEVVTDQPVGMVLAVLSLLMAVVYFVGMPVLWFRFAVHLGRRARGTAAAPAQPSPPPSAETGGAGTDTDGWRRPPNRVAIVQRWERARIALQSVDGVHVTTLVEVPRRAAPAVVVPAHCTLWKAQHALAAGLPAAFRPNGRQPVRSRVRHRCRCPMGQGSVMPLVPVGFETPQSQRRGARLSSRASAARWNRPPVGDERASSIEEQISRCTHQLSGCWPSPAAQH